MNVDVSIDDPVDGGDGAACVDEVYGGAYDPTLAAVMMAAVFLDGLHSVLLRAFLSVLNWLKEQH